MAETEEEMLGDTGDGTPLTPIKGGRAKSRRTRTSFSSRAVHSPEGVSAPLGQSEFFSAFRYDSRHYKSETRLPNIPLKRSRVEARRHTRIFQPSQRFVAMACKSRGLLLLHQGLSRAPVTLPLSSGLLSWWRQPIEESIIQPVGCAHSQLC